jgi:hypothetical protein
LEKKKEKAKKRNIEKDVLEKELKEEEKEWEEEIPAVSDYSARPIRFGYYSPYIGKSYFGTGEEKLLFKALNNLDELRFEVCNIIYVK